MWLYRQPAATSSIRWTASKASCHNCEPTFPASIHLNVLQDRTGPIRAHRRHPRTMEIALCWSSCGIRIPAKLAGHGDTGISFRYANGKPSARLYLFGYTVDNLSLMRSRLLPILVDDASNDRKHHAATSNGLSPCARPAGAKEIGQTVIIHQRFFERGVHPDLLMGGIVGRLSEFPLRFRWRSYFSLAITLATTR